MPAPETDHLDNTNTIGQDGRKNGRAASVPGKPPRVAVLGVGFSGLWATQSLSRGPVHIRLIDQHNYTTFFPLLYQVGAAELDAEDITYPIRHIFRKVKNFQFYLETVEHVDLEKRIVKTGEQEINYDYLVIGLGSRPNFYDIPGANEYTYTLKTIDQGIALRNHILYCFERATREDDPQRRREWLTFNIVGGGPTGVEFAGALAELIQGSLCRDYPKIDMAQTHVVLVEALEHLLLGFPTSLGDYAKRRLEKMGVDVRLNSRVVEIKPDCLRLQDGTELSSNTVVWTAGVHGAPRADQWGLPVTRNGQVKVLPTLQVPDHPEVYVAGDLAWFEEGGHPLPQVAQVAMQQGKLAGENILRQIKGEAPQPFHYRDKGMLAEIGRNAAAAQVWGRSFTGFLAWILWVGVHITYLIGFRNRIVVLVNWAWDYFFSEQGVRMIVPANAVSKAMAPEVQPKNSATRSD